jgi:hypothetical protein
MGWEAVRNPEGAPEMGQKSSSGRRPESVDQLQSTYLSSVSIDIGYSRLSSEL